MRSQTPPDLFLSLARIASDQHSAQRPIVFTPTASGPCEPNNNDDYLNLKIVIGIGIMATMVMVAFYLRHISKIVESMRDAKQTTKSAAKRPRYRINHRNRPHTETVIDGNAGITVRTFSFNHEDSDGDQLNTRGKTHSNASSQEKTKLVELVEYAEQNKINRIVQADQTSVSEQQQLSRIGNRNTKSNPKETKGDQISRVIREKKAREKTEKKEKEKENFKIKKELDSLKQTRNLQRQEEKEREREREREKKRRDDEKKIQRLSSSGTFANSVAAEKSVKLITPDTKVTNKPSRLFASSENVLNEHSISSQTVSLYLPFQDIIEATKNIHSQPEEGNSTISDLQIQEEVTDFTSSHLFSQNLPLSISVVDNQDDDEDLLSSNNESQSEEEGTDVASSSFSTQSSSQIAVCSTKKSLQNTSDLDTSQSSHKSSSISKGALTSLLANPEVMERLFNNKFALKEIRFTPNSDQSYSMDLTNFIKSLAFLYLFHRYNTAFFDWCFANSSRILRTNLVHTFNNTKIKLRSLLETQKKFHEHGLIKPKATSLYVDYNYTDERITNITEERKRLDPVLVFTWIRSTMIPFINFLDTKSKEQHYPIEPKIIKTAIKFLIIAIGEYCDESKRNHFKELLNKMPNNLFYQNCYNFIRISSFMRNKLAHDKPFDEDTPEWLQEHMLNKVDPKKSFEEAVISEWLRIAKLINRVDIMCNHINFDTLLLPESMLPLYTLPSFATSQALIFSTTKSQDNASSYAKRPRSKSAPQQLT